MSKPPAEVHVEAATVAALVGDACPELAAHAPHAVGDGWDNAIFRLGPRHAVRLPRREAAVPLLLHERRWLPVLAPRLPVAVPVPVVEGAPGPRFPWPWHVVPWIEGETAEGAPLDGAGVDALAAVLGALHAPAPDDAPANPLRGGPLAARDDAFQERLGRLGRRPDVDVGRVGAIWREACTLPATDARTWLHGDLHPRNVVLRDGRLVGLLDWGDVCAGDRATDLAGAWFLVRTPDERRRLLRLGGADGETLRRALGWALHLSLAHLESGDATHGRIGRDALTRVLHDA